MADAPSRIFSPSGLGRDVPIHAPALNEMVKVLAELLGAEAPTVNLRLDGIAFPSGRDLMAFCDAAGDDFDRVTWQAGLIRLGHRTRQFRLR